MGRVRRARRSARCRRRGRERWPWSLSKCVAFGRANFHSLRFSALKVRVFEITRVAMGLSCLCVVVVVIPKGQEEFSFKGLNGVWDWVRYGRLEGPACIYLSRLRVASSSLIGGGGRTPREAQGRARG